MQMTQALPAFAIFEGGGAKGIGHVAGLAALEVNDFELIGVAGSSAGSIIAALVSVGYTADELFDERQPLNNVLTRNGESPLTLFDKREWESLQTAVKRGRGWVSTVKWTGVIGGWLYSRTITGAAKDVSQTAGLLSAGKLRSVIRADRGETVRLEA
jgi:predicted acylesterase/phospholipase RssA